MTDGRPPADDGRTPGEHLPPGWDGQAAPPVLTSIDDEVLAGHLHRRATHRPLPRMFATAIVGRVDETEPVRRWRLVVAAWRPRLAVAVSGLTLALLAGLLYVGSGPPRNGGPQTLPPTLGPTPTAPPVGFTWDPTVRAMTPPDLLRFLATSPAPGTVLIVDDQIVPFLVSCAAAEHCPSGQLRNASGVFVEPPPGGHLPYAIDPTIATTSITGPLALRVGGGPNLVFLGAVVGNGLRMAFTAHDLAARSAAGGLFVIPGWLWKAAPLPCPTSLRTPPPVPTSELGLPAPGHDICAGGNYLTDEPPLLPVNGSPNDGLAMQDGAYAGFAPDPDSAGAARDGVFLVRDWAGFGEVLARLEPLFVPSDEATTPTTEPTAPPTVGPSPSTAGGIVLSVDELVRRVLDGELKQGAIAVVSVPASVVSDRWAPGVVHSCPQLCPTWVLKGALGGSLSVAVSERLPVPRSIVGVQAFLVLDGGSIRALGPAATGRTGAPLPGTVVLPVADGLSVIHGWLRLGPPLLCPQRPAPLETGILGEPLAWSQCPGTWVLPTADDPWSGSPGSPQASDRPGDVGIGDLSVPAGTLHVQDGRGQATLDPVEGMWLVRAAVTNACPPWARCPAATNPDIPQPGITWYELVGPIVRPAPATPVPELSPAPSTPASALVLSRERLVADVTSGLLRPGSIVLADTTIAPVLLPSFPPDPGTIVGKIGPLTVHWVSSEVDSSATRPIALRVRADGGLDYLSPALLDADDRPFASSSVPTGQGLVLVHGWFYRPTFDLECREPFGPDSAFRAFDGGKQVLACDPAFVLPTSKEPVIVNGGTRLVEIPTGALSVQIRNQPRGGPTEGLFLVRHIGCLWSDDLDVCPVPAGPVWELVGPVVVPGN